MAFSYDFDIFDVVPSKNDHDPELEAFLQRIGFDPDHGHSKIALFRNETTAEALRVAPPAVRDYFLEAGFGLNTYQSGAPPGRYPAKDEDARLILIERLSDLAGQFPLPAEPTAPGQFSLHDFLRHLGQATPIEMEETTALPVDAVSAPVPKSAPAASAAQGGGFANKAARFWRAMPILSQRLRHAASP
ncbi:hypothetical protein [Pseudotabrizicola sp. L79]|uniref:hypothetical protein n=1 Tax=Pseudotabrizicola sp. L79 TaxID=3118402 RepID=UPI002F952C17